MRIFRKLFFAVILPALMFGIAAAQSLRSPDEVKKLFWGNELLERSIQEIDQLGFAELVALKSALSACAGELPYKEKFAQYSCEVAIKRYQIEYGGIAKTGIAEFLEAYRLALEELAAELLKEKNPSNSKSITQTILHTSIFVSRKKEVDRKLEWAVSRAFVVLRALPLLKPH